MNFPVALIPGGATIFVKNIQAEILPKAIEKEIPQLLANLISRICKTFTAVFTNSLPATRRQETGKP
jgi:hypothetical protein